ncbi:SDR family oxidoreductase [Mariluticola halotolerans]|uniref:SDR family oxidoreductase n=1 Tax=Mariluticola halotolerans TaxID=2909283 RepID=UPI0026E2AED8|nr:SDR family oxidoreductase [Mariluticola halotolerans]UJQ95350.1 SDR family oxidoreductase [Mariluticola halotolerans]
MHSLSMFDLTGKRALITGSSRGIGRALAEGLAGAGAEILLNGRNTKALGNAAQDLADAGAKVTALAFDVTNPESVDEAIAHAEAEIGAIDILINNAGMQYRAPLESFPPDKFDALMRTNVNSAFYVGQAVAKNMIGRGRGKIINICSVMSRLARPSIAPYSASKGAVANLTKGMATDWARHGLNVNGIAPGYFKTELNAALVADADFSTWLEHRTPMGRWAETSELVGAAIFLGSDASSFVNGHILYVDGGISISV